jgi:hypothetical protein
VNFRLYINVAQNPDAFGDATSSVAARILRMSNHNAAQAGILHALEEDGWEIDHDSTEQDAIVFHADRDFATEADAINASRVAGALAHAIDRYENQKLTASLTTHLPDTPVAVGDRFAITQDIERFPMFIVKRGMTGTITEAEPDLIALTLDEHIDGAEEWDNALIVTPDDHPLFVPEGVTEPSENSAHDAFHLVAVRILPVAE